MKRKMTSVSSHAGKGMQDVFFAVLLPTVAQLQ